MDMKGNNSYLLKKYSKKCVDKNRGLEQIFQKLAKR